MDKIRSPKPEKTLPVYLLENELKLLLALPERKKWQNWRRDKAILYLLAYTGFRRAELLSLTWEDIRFDQKAIRVMGKRRQERIIPMNEALSEVLWAYLETQLPVPRNRELFLTRTGRPLSRWVSTTCSRSTSGPLAWMPHESLPTRCAIRSPPCYSPAAPIW